MVNGLSNIFLTSLNVLIGFLTDVSEYVIENKVASRLLSKYERLHKFLEFGGFVGRLPNDLDDNIVVRGLRVDIGDADFAVLKVEILDTLLDGLGKLAKDCSRRLGRLTLRPIETGVTSASGPETN